MEASNRKLHEYSVDEIEQLYNEGKVNLDTVKRYGVQKKIVRGGVHSLSAAELEAGYNSGMLNKDHVEEYREKKQNFIGYYIKDLGRGLTYGARDFVQETLTFAEHTAEWLMSHDSTDAMYGIDSPEDSMDKKQGIDIETGTLPDEEGLGIDRPKTMLGGMAKEVTQLGLGMAAPLGILNKVSKVGKFADLVAQAPKIANILKAGVAGSWASFSARDPYDPTMTDFIDQLVDPEHELEGPVWGFLKSDPNRPEFLARLSQAVNDFAGGVLIDAGVGVILKGVKLAKLQLFTKHSGDMAEVAAEVTSRKGKADAKAIATGGVKGADIETAIAKKADRPKRTKQSKAELNRNAKKLMAIAKGEAKSDLQAGVKTPINKSNVDWDSVGQNVEEFMDQVQHNIKKDMQGIMGPEYKSHAATATRAKRSLAVLAETLDENPEDFFQFMTKDIELSREVYSALDEKVTAYRHVLPQYADYVTDIAANASRGGATKEEVLHAFAHMAQLHEMAAGVKGIGTEIGRGLSAHNIVVQNLGDLDALAKAAGGIDNMTVNQMKGALDIFSQAADVPRKLRVAKNALKYKWGSAFLTYRQATLLWSMATHARNIGTNAVLLTGGTITRTLGAVGHAAWRRDLAPLKAMYQYMTKGGGALLDTFRLPVISKEWAEKTGTFWKVLKTGIPETDLAGKVLMDDSMKQIVGKIPFIGKPMGEILSVPFKGLAAADEAFATVAAKAEGARLSMLRSIDEVGSLVKQGDVLTENAAEEVAKRYGKRLVSPDKDIWEMAIQNKRDVTMTDPIKRGTIEGKFFDMFTPNPALLKDDGIGAAIKYNAPFFVRGAAMPFYNIAVNMFKMGMRFSPGFNMLNKRFWDDIAMGGARRADRIAATTMSFAAGWALWEGAASGYITGGLPRSANSLGKGGKAPKYSINASLWGGNSNEWVSYEFAMPFAFTIGMVADAQQLHSEWGMEDDNPVVPEDENETGQAMYKFMAILSDNLMRGSFITGPRQLSEILLEPKKAGKKAEYFAFSFLSTMVPAGTGLQFWQRQLDPLEREVNNWWDAVVNKNINSKALPPKRDPLSGERVERQRGFTRTFGDDPARKALFEANVNVTAMPRKITDRGQEIELDDAQWQELNDLYEAEDVMKKLNKVVKRPSFQRDGSDKSRAKKLRKEITKARTRAKEKFLRNHKDMGKALREADKRERRARGGHGKSESPISKPYKDILK